MVNIFLIRPKIDAEYAEVNTGYSVNPPPIGLEMLASYAAARISNAKIKIYSDIDYLPTDHSHDFVGISDWFSNHKNAISIARDAKERNSDCKIILGGPNASNLGNRILQNHTYIDYVVCGDGEETFTRLLTEEIKNEELAQIPNLWYRDENNNIRYTFDKNSKLNENPLFDLNHLVDFDVKPYDSRRDDFVPDIDRTPIPISSIRGCIKAAKLGKCSYCNIPSKMVRVMNPNRTWEQISKL